MLGGLSCSFLRRGGDGIRTLDADGSAHFYCHGSIYHGGDADTCPRASDNRHDLDFVDTLFCALYGSIVRPGLLCYVSCYCNLFLKMILLKSTLQKYYLFLAN